MHDWPASVTFVNMIGSIGVRTVRKRLSPTTPMMCRFMTPVPGENSSLRTVLPIASCGDLKPSFLHRIFVQDDVDAARGHRSLDILVGRERRGHVVHRPVRIEPAAGLQRQAHRVEEAFVDLVLVDADLLVAARRDEAGLVVVVGVDADVGPADGDDARERASSARRSSRPCRTAGRGRARRPGGCGRA